MNDPKRWFAGWLLAVCCAVTFGELAGCSLLETTVDLPFRAIKAVLPGGRETEPVDPVTLQEEMLRFADNFEVSTTSAAENLQKNGQPISRSELLNIKIVMTSGVYGLATGPSALANLVSLTVMVSGARSRVQHYWLPKVYGKSAQPVLDALRAREQQIWAIANRVLKPDMQAELRSAIDTWEKESASPLGELQAFASVSLVNEITRHNTEGRRRFMPSSVFALLDMDPLAGLDPATRELTETRLFAERALFIGQRMPQLLAWQMELLAMRSTTTPQVTELIASTSRIAGAGDRLSQTAERIPGLLASEREQLLRGLQKEQQGLGDLSRNFGQTFAEGGKMADATGQALNSFQAILTQLEKIPSDPNSKPFEIRDYAETANAINRMSQQVNELLKTFLLILDPANLAKLSAQTELLTRQTEERGQRLVDYAFRQGLLLVALATLILLTGGLLYQWLRPRTRATPN